MKRAEFSRTTKMKAFQRAAGKCEKCGYKFHATDPKEFDHQKPCAIGGGNSLENCLVLCVSCHKNKTVSDIGKIRKADRQRAYHQGFKVRKGKGFATNKDGKYKRKMSGEIVRRDAK